MAKAYVLISCESGADASVISNLKRISTVKEAHGMFGTYDVLAKLESESDYELNHVIPKKIRQIKKIRATLTLHTDGKDHFGKTLNSSEKDVLETYMASAYVLISCYLDEKLAIIESLSKIPEIIEGDIVIGSYDILCKVMAPTYNDIADIISRKIRKLQNIKSTLTLNVIPENELFR
jgi:DNA-binding Lrp family transcriptional regulator